MTALPPRSWLLLMAALLLALAACGERKETPGQATPQATEVAKASATTPPLPGTYLLVKDSDGTVPKPGATVTLVLNADGTLSLRAVQPGEELTDYGAYSVRGDRMSIEFREQEIAAKDTPYKYDGQTLEIPVKMFSEGSGSSIWKRSEAEVKAQPSPRAKAKFEADWDMWDLNQYAPAAAMKFFVEAVNEKGKPWEQAVQEAAQLARGFTDVDDVVVSPNGLNFAIRYKDGTKEDVFTETWVFSVEGRGGQASLPSPSEASAQLVAMGAPSPDYSLASTCSQNRLPGLPTDTAGAPSPYNRTDQPGREGLDLRKVAFAGQFGVVDYQPQLQPIPLHSNDSPPIEAQRALLIAPLYDVPHPVRLEDGTVGMSSFRDLLGPHMDCLVEDLARAQYGVRLIMGGGALRGDIDVLVEVIKALTSYQYGLIYFLSHAGGATPGEYSIHMGMLDKEMVRRVIGNRQITPETANRLRDVIGGEILQQAGLEGPDYEQLKGYLKFSAEPDGRVGLHVEAGFFRELRRTKSLSFDRSLVFANTCSSALFVPGVQLEPPLFEAFKPRAFLGWQAGAAYWSGRAAEVIIDLLNDKARSVRNAWWMWRIHEFWIRKVAPGERPQDWKPEALRGYGTRFARGPAEAYNLLAGQTVALIYRIRHGPSTATAQVASGIAAVQNCWEERWSQGITHPLASPACFRLEDGQHQPTREEVDDAIFEAGGAIEKPFGRWTLRD